MPSNTTTSSLSPSPPPAAVLSASRPRLLEALSIVLVVVFLAAVLTTALPPRLLDPQWQLGFTETLINNASLALIGALLLPLAGWFDPAHKRLRALWKAIHRCALAASLGFLLLVPLQGYAGWTFYSTVTASQQQQTSQASQKLADLRQAIATATTHDELQVRVRKLFGQNAGLSPAEFRTPMAVLRPMLLARAQQASNQLMQRVEAQAAMKPDRLVKETIRITVSAIAYAIGFAFLAGVLPRNHAPGAPRWSRPFKT
ncbi:HpsJ family protein [Synechococcus sp. CS-1332]|uniref:HpsJ family protein n=1 Tax=Synechococcus sp. CS-1332 TaxID=2847972 RepID=UPI00223B98BB|nr:HpsJ family protein [Synechococcus sp. CS-1332]MCT0207923.1 HpsJ family protein [Synechococcus sp. CS-1332]